LQPQITAINTIIATMTAEVIRDRQAIADAQSQSSRGIVETIFGVLFAPFTGGLSLILAGIGVASIVEAQSKVKALESTIKSYQDRIVASQQNLAQDQAQLVTLNGLLVSGSIALSDVQVSSQMLDQVRTSWDAFFQEMNGIVGRFPMLKMPASGWWKKHGSCRLQRVGCHRNGHPGHYRCHHHYQHGNVRLLRRPGRAVGARWQASAHTGRDEDRQLLFRHQPAARRPIPRYSAGEPTPIGLRTISITAWRCACWHTTRITGW
jgi:hypothetical protein